MCFLTWTMLTFFTWHCGQYLFSQLWVTLEQLGHEYVCCLYYFCTFLLYQTILHLLQIRFSSLQRKYLLKVFIYILYLLLFTALADSSHVCIQLRTSGCRYNPCTERSKCQCQEKGMTWIQCSLHLELLECELIIPSPILEITLGCIRYRRESHLLLQYVSSTQYLVRPLICVAAVEIQIDVVGTHV